MTKNETKKIAIIGNSGGGKTQLARVLAAKLNLPVTHVDSIQFVNNKATTPPPQLKPTTPQIRPFNESIKIIEEIQNRQEWIIDGYGPLDILEKRLALADLIIFIDLPIWRHYLWCAKRQLSLAIRSSVLALARNQHRPARTELPEGTTELTLEHTKKLFKSLWQVHTKMRPEMLRILERNDLKNKVIYMRSVEDLKKIGAR